jgi:hypothetical protein
MPTPFLDLCNDMQISSPKNVADIVRRSFGSLVHESVLFLALGYDYWFNPADVKASGLWEAFMLKGSSLELNIPSKPSAEIRALLSDPKVSVRKEVTGETVNLKMRAFGGFVEGGAANYNLCTKALDVAADGIDPATKRGIKQGVQQNLAGSNAPPRDLMVTCYKELRNWWSDSDLARIGLIAR